jgi:hypothetical protein
MRQITININPSIYEHIMFFLQNLPKNLIDIQYPNKKIPTSSNLSSSKAFGILNGKIKDPVKWQKEIREESDRDIYRDFEK